MSNKHNMKSVSENEIKKRRRSAVKAIIIFFAVVPASLIGLSYIDDIFWLEKTCHIKWHNIPTVARYWNDGDITVGDRNILVTEDELLQNARVYNCWENKYQ